MICSRLGRSLALTLACAAAVLGVGAPAAAAAPKPAVWSLSSHFSPLEGGAVLAVHGGNLHPSTRITIGGVLVHPVGRATSSVMHVRVPRHRAGTVYVRVRTSRGISDRSGRSALTYVSPASISAVAPRYVPAGRAATITVSGHNLAHATGVWFGGTYIHPLPGRTDARLRVVAPAHRSGVESVRVRSPYGNSATASLTVLSAPRIATAELASGAVAHPYNQHLDTVDHRAGTWSVIRGTVPPGLRLSGSSLLGTPTRSAATDLGIRLTDAAGQRADATLRLTVTDPFAASSFDLPADAKSGTGNLSGIDCPSSTMCAAVGTYQTTDGHTRGLLATRTDGTWSTVAMGSVDGQDTYPLHVTATKPISCGNDGGCAVLGVSDGLDRRPVLSALVDGVWTTFAAPAPGGNVTLRAVSCAGTGSCVAVGEGPRDAVLLTETRGTWTDTPLPDSVTSLSASSLLTDVDCSSPTECTAVGEIDQPHLDEPLVLTLSSGVWAQSQVPAPEGSVERYPQDTGLYSVSCPTAATCTAVGTSDDQPLVATETPDGWRTSNPRLGWTGVLREVSCNATRCLSSGDGQDSDTATVLLGELHGLTWASVRIPKTTTTITAVNCSNEGTPCVITGAGTETGDGVALIGTVDDTTTYVERAPVPPRGVVQIQSGTVSGLSGVSCPQGGTCVAVGGYRTTDGGSPLVVSGGM